MKKRYPGISKTPDGRFKIRVVETDPRTGKTKHARKIMPHGATLEEALTQQALMKKEIRDGHPKETPKARRCVNDFAEQWIEAKAERIRPSVAEHYAQVLATFILPQFGDIYLDAVRREDLIDFARRLEKLRMKSGKQYARQTVMGFWSICRRFLKDAAAAAKIPDPTLRVDPPNPPAIQRRELRTLTKEQLKDLLDAVKQYFPDRYAEVFLLAYTGMRAGELYALRWEDIRPDEGKIKIERSVWHQNVNGTKTGVGREVAYLDEMGPVLREHRMRMVEQNHVALDSGIVFPADNGEYRMSQSLHKTLDLAAEAAGIDVKVTPQVLRRTFNTLMLEEGTDRIVLRAQMGHTREEMTQRYAGVKIESKLDAVRKLLPGEDGREVKAEAKPVNGLLGLGEGEEEPQEAPKGNVIPFRRPGGKK